MAEQEYVKVRRQFDDYKIATYRIEDIEGLHWDRISGGIQSVSPQRRCQPLDICFTEWYLDNRYLKVKIGKELAMFVIAHFCVGGVYKDIVMEYGGLPLRKIFFQKKNFLKFYLYHNFLK